MPQNRVKDRALRVKGETDYHVVEVSQATMLPPVPLLLKMSSLWLFRETAGISLFISVRIETSFGSYLT